MGYGKRSWTTARIGPACHRAVTLARHRLDGAADAGNISWEQRTGPRLCSSAAHAFLRGYGSRAIPSQGWSYRPSDPRRWRGYSEAFPAAACIHRVANWPLRPSKTKTGACDCPIAVFTSFSYLRSVQRPCRLYFNFRMSSNSRGGCLSSAQTGLLDAPIQPARSPVEMMPCSHPYIAPLSRRLATLYTAAPRLFLASPA